MTVTAIEKQPSPQAIAGASRRLIRSIELPANPTPAEEAALRRIEADHRYASAWLLHASSLAGHRLPTGNGLNGPWHLTAHITSSKHFALVDIAKGVAVEYDVIVPRRVARFALDTNQRSYSPNYAGGSGSQPRHWRQIVLALTEEDRRSQVRVQVRRLITTIKPVSAVYGYTTCYGRTGTWEDANRDYPEISDSMWSQCAEPQQERTDICADTDLLEAFISTRLPYTLRGSVSLGKSCFGCKSDVYVLGTIEQRKEVKNDLMRCWVDYMAKHVDETVQQAASKLGMPASVKERVCDAVQRALR